MTRRITALVAAASLALAPAASAQARAQGGRISLAAIAAADSLNKQATAAYNAKQWPQAAAGWTSAAGTPGARQVGTMRYNAACAYALGGDATHAFEQLRLAIAAGWHDAGLLERDTDLASLHADTRWARLLADTRGAAAAYRRQHADPQRARLVTSDIPLFWRAYDLARSAPDSAAKVDVYRREYVERASPGYVDYFFSKIGSVARLAAFVERHRDYYDGVRGTTGGVVRMDPQMRQAFRRMKELYPDAFFPDVYFGIGRLSSGGTVSDRGLLIGTEMYGVGPATPTGKLPEYAQHVVSPIGELPHTVAHELVHFEQSPSSGDLLNGALIEGGADFIGELILPGGATPEYRRFGLEHEREVWQRFASEMHGHEQGNWIGSAGQRIEAFGGWPGDLGYFEGYQIAKAYYEQATDKRQAIRDLLELKDPEAILRASGYAERFRN